MCLAIDNTNPMQQICTAINHKISFFVALADVNEDTIYIDLTCFFLVRSFSGTQYISTAYVYTINAILIKPMTSMTDANMVDVFKEI